MRGLAEPCFSRAVPSYGPEVQLEGDLSGMVTIRTVANLSHRHGWPCPGIARGLSAQLIGYWHLKCN